MIGENSQANMEPEAAVFGCLRCWTPLGRD